MDVTADPLGSGLRAMRNQPVATPRGLAGKLMADVRSYPRRGRDIPIGDAMSVNETELAAAVRTVAATVGGGGAGGCRIRPHRGAAGRPITGPLEVELSFAVSYGSSIRAAGQALMAKVGAALAERYGLSVGQLRLKAVDVTPTTPR